MTCVAWPYLEVTLFWKAAICPGSHPLRRLALGSRRCFAHVRARRKRPSNTRPKIGARGSDADQHLRATMFGWILKTPPPAPASAFFDPCAKAAQRRRPAITKSPATTSGPKPERSSPPRSSRPTETGRQAPAFVLPGPSMEPHLTSPTEDPPCGRPIHAVWSNRHTQAVCQISGRGPTTRGADTAAAPTRPQGTSATLHTTPTRDVVGAHIPSRPGQGGPDRCRSDARAPRRGPSADCDTEPRRSSVRHFAPNVALQATWLYFQDVAT